MTDRNHIDLMPCPFCGASPMDHAIEPHTHSPFLKQLGIPNHGGSHVVECGCGAGLIDDTKEAVFAHWNRRALSARASAGEGALRDALRCVLDIAARRTLLPSEVTHWEALLVTPFLTAAPQPAQTQGDGHTCNEACYLWHNPVASQPAAAHSEDSLRKALEEICDYEGDPNTPVKNSVKKSAIARAALAAAPQPPDSVTDCATYSAKGGPYTLRTTPPAHGDGEVDAWLVEWSGATGTARRAFVKRENADEFVARKLYPSLCRIKPLHLATRPTPTAEPAGVDRDAVALSVLAALGHKPKEDDRCRARVVHKHPMGRPPGPGNTPIFCCLKAGHEGQHRCNHGGMSPSFPFRESDEVEFGKPITTCEKCRTTWPCHDARAALAASGGA